uniref:Putative GINS complex, subunit Psf1 n=1 Tax=Davidia involucrata TaxID=16924 RepID=A0A5B7BPF4_DAVIN
MYGKKACELVKEFSSSEPGQLAAFNTNLFAQVNEECNFHFLQLQSLLSKVQGEGSDSQTTKDADHFGALIHHLSLVRNKRCLMAYVYNRAEVIRSLGWTIEPPLPEEIQEKLSSSEKEYSKNHSATIKSYRSELDLDLAVDMVPPKDPYIKVRVLDDIGTVALSDQIANLARHAILFLRRTDAETYISQGLMEELTG